MLFTKFKTTSVLAFVFSVVPCSVTGRPDIHNLGDLWFCHLWWKLHVNSRGNASDEFSWNVVLFTGSFQTAGSFERQNRKLPDQTQFAINNS